MPSSGPKLMVVRARRRAGAWTLRAFTLLELPLPLRAKYTDACIHSAYMSSEVIIGFAIGFGIYCCLHTLNSMLGGQVCTAMWKLGIVFVSTPWEKGYISAVLSCHL